MQHWCYKFLLFLLLSFLGASVFCHQVPELGTMDTGSLSKEKEKAMGAQIFFQLKQAHALLEDPLATHYLQTLGDKIASGNGSRSHEPIHFFWINDQNINAFALPGRLIGVHIGLIRFAKTESDLAAVLAHEIAHVEERHLAQLYTYMSRMQWKSFAAVLAAVALALGKNSNAATGAIAAGSASQMQSALNFTREHEAEADRVGLDLLVRAGFPAKAMPEFFTRLEQQQRFQTQVPPFLRSHPLTSERLTTSTRLAEQFPNTATHDVLSFHLMRARLDLLSSKIQPETKRKLEQQLHKEHHFSKVALQYEIAKLNSLLGNTSGALPVFISLQKEYPEENAFALDLAELYAEQQDLKTAIQLLEQPAFKQRHPILQLKLCDFLIQDQQAARSLQLLRDLELQEYFSPDLFYLRAKAYATLKQPYESALAQADYYWLQGMPTESLWQLERIINSTNPKNRVYQQAEARLKEFQAVLSTKSVDNSVER